LGEARASVDQDDVFVAVFIRLLLAPKRTAR
jgi:hypothetical protein